MTDHDERARWIARIGSMRRYQRDGERAPHKPLLLLYALGQLSAGHRDLAWIEAEDDLKRLLDAFGPPNPTAPNHPFRRLAGDDGLWDLDAAHGEVPSLNASSRQLRDAGVVGRLSEELVGAIDEDPALAVVVARSLLEDNWPASLHDDIASAVGLDLDGAEAALALGRLARTRRRDPRFRERILVAYEYRCGICGYDGWLDRSAVGLEAAHVRWWSVGGPDTVDNGLSVCSLHHVLLDSGVLGIDRDHRIQVSKRFVARSPAGEDMVLALAGAEVRTPQRGEPAIADDNLDWHAAQVFRGPPRAAA